MHLLPLFAAISGDALLNSFIWLVVAGLIFWLVMWAVRYIGVPEPFNKVIRVVVVLVAVVFLINFLMGLAGRPFITW